MEKYYQAIAYFHKKHRMKGINNEDMTFRLNLMTERIMNRKKKKLKNRNYRVSEFRKK